jgi:hypothetical protein
MANYFIVALTSTTRPWLMNLPPWSLYSCEELCHQFMANFESSYSQLDNEVNLHTVQQRPGSHCGPSSSGSPRFKTPSPTSKMLLLSSHFDRV